MNDSVSPNKSDPYMTGEIPNDHDFDISMQLELEEQEREKLWFYDIYDRLMKSIDLTLLTTIDEIGRAHV